jgi:hypothetical protein
MHLVRAAWNNLRSCAGWPVDYDALVLTPLSFDALDEPSPRFFAERGILIPRYAAPVLADLAVGPDAVRLAPRFAVSSRAARACCSPRVRTRPRCPYSPRCLPRLSAAPRLRAGGGAAAPAGRECERGHSPVQRLWLRHGVYAHCACAQTAGRCTAPATLYVKD